jgi:hypothetical protein
MRRRGLALTAVITCGRAVLVGLAAWGVLVQPEIVAVLVPVAIVAAIITYSHTELNSRADDRSRIPLQAASATAIKVYSGGLSVLGLVVLGGYAAPSIILTFVALTAVALWWAREQNIHGWLLVGDYSPGEPPTPTWPLEAATTTQLRERWRATYLQLRHAPNPIVRTRTAALRRDLLTEFQRRDPAGFSRYLASRNPAARYPVRFCRQHASITPNRLTSQQ